jgi:hypothetical protein
MSKVQCCSPFLRKRILIAVLVKSQISICISRKESVPILGNGSGALALTLMTNVLIVLWQLEALRMIP